MSKVPELLPCPFCGGALVQREARVNNPHAECRTEDCYGAKMPVVNLDVHSDVAASNTRTPTPPPATPVEAVRVLTRCPDGCFRPKATNADDCAAGCCSQWYAVNDAEAAAECSKLASFWRDPSIQDDAKLWRFCEQSGFPHASYGPGGDGKWRTYWFHRKARGEEFDDPISSVRAAIANQARSEP